VLAIEGGRKAGAWVRFKKPTMPHSYQDVHFQKFIGRKSA